jgi:hypothetical protein
MSGDIGTQRRRSLLAGLLVFDLVFISIHLWLLSASTLQRFPQLNIELDHSLPEYFMYLKWLIAILATAVAFDRARVPIYAAWCVLFIYFLLDDALRMHEQLGGWITASLALKSTFFLRGQDIGELLVYGAVGSLLLGQIVLGFFLSGDERARRFSRTLAVALIALIFFAVVVDMLHIVAFRLRLPMGHLVGVLEDGGEMVVGSFIAWITACHAVSLRSS